MWHRQNRNTSSPRISDKVDLAVSASPHDASANLVPEMVRAAAYYSVTTTP